HLVTELESPGAGFAAVLVIVEQGRDEGVQEPCTKIVGRRGRRLKVGGGIYDGAVRGPARHAAAGLDRFVDIRAAVVDPRLRGAAHGVAGKHARIVAGGGTEHGRGGGGGLVGNLRVH